MLSQNHMCYGSLIFFFFFLQIEIYSEKKEQGKSHFEGGGKVY